MNLSSARLGDVVLVVAPHPDDETLGAGGTIAKLSAHGATVHVLAVTCRTNVTCLGGSDPGLRGKEFEVACDALGVVGRRLAWVDTDLAVHPHRHPRELVELIESGTDISIASVRPDVLLIPAGNGFHQDHHAVYRAGLAAARLGGTAQRAPRIVLGYSGPEEQWTGDFNRMVFVDTSSTWDAKRRALSAYQSQLRPAPHPRSIEVISTLDEATGLRVGAPRAEAFVPYRMVC
ncbi:PIG-L deacetylase family protein [Plantactinospora sp. CA-290183]|uniref:PIG-L deacetylase family protein n=1 Tax=Plantactinospora sp. CA-290183 TaxID=3240006 RepID=UPI003D8B8FBB